MRAAVVALVAGLTSTAVLADDAALAQRVKQLEATVESLSARVKTLEEAPRLQRVPTAAEPQQEKAWNLPIGKSAVLGPKKARYTLVVFSDLQCPFCSRVDPFLRDLVNDPELKGKINVVFKHFPLSFHKDARPAARIAIGIQQVGGDKAAWDFIELAFQNQRALSDEFYLTAIDQLQLARRPVLAAAEKADAIIGEDIALGTDSGVRGTPSLFVNGWELKQRSIDGVKALINEHKL